MPSQPTTRPRATDQRSVPPVERANGWIVALAVLAGAVLFSTLALSAFTGS